MFLTPQTATVCQQSPYLSGFKTHIKSWVLFNIEKTRNWKSVSPLVLKHNAGLENWKRLNPWTKFRLISASLNPKEKFKLHPGPMEYFLIFQQGWPNGLNSLAILVEKWQATIEQLRTCLGMGPTHWKKDLLACLLHLNKASGLNLPAWLAWAGNQLLECLTLKWKIQFGKMLARQSRNYGLWKDIAKLMDKYSACFWAPRDASTMSRALLPQLTAKWKTKINMGPLNKGILKHIQQAVWINKTWTAKSWPPHHHPQVAQVNNR